ncbi:proline-rich receptor-like protein kinase PERK4 [Apium graveolens]|uniref:proline-rich receptor-like protein kinase PERK4 n=1 Tax=Apium graveolens TaxID=4045 RepID=UPI003D7B9AA6
MSSNSPPSSSDSSNQSPPTPSSSSGSPPPPQDSSPPPPDKDNNKKSPPPPSPSSENSHGPQPPHNGRQLPPQHKSKSSSSGDSQSDGGTSNVQKKAIIGGVVGGTALLILFVLACYWSFCRKKKNRKPHEQMIYYRENSRGKSNANYSSGQPTGGIDPPAEHRVNIPQSGNTGVSSKYGWEGQPPPPPMAFSNSEVSSSGRHQPAMPPPHPALALGFNKSNFSYDELADATGGFGKANLLGEGGFGFVYKGLLSNDKEIAVKSLKPGSFQGEREFQAEVDIISRVHHRHLVSLVGYCIADDKRMLVYEFVKNDTLDHHLHGKGVAVMDWSLRIQTAVGAAKGFAYLHEDCHPRIIHRDIKTSNILLDEKHVAKVADFGLAKLCSDDYTHVSTRIMGTFGYLAPEYASTGKLTEKSDVYSFGVVLLELISGKRPINVNSQGDSLADWARPILMRSVEGESYEQLVDPRLEDNYDPEEMLRMVACSAACINRSARRRPKMSQLVNALEGHVTLDHLSDRLVPVQSSPFINDISEGESSYSADM